MDWYLLLTKLCSLCFSYRWYSGRTVKLLILSRAMSVFYSLVTPHLHATGCAIFASWNQKRTQVALKYSLMNASEMFYTFEQDWNHSWTVGLQSERMDWLASSTSWHLGGMTSGGLLFWSQADACEAAPCGTALNRRLSICNSLTRTRFSA